MKYCIETFVKEDLLEKLNGMVQDAKDNINIDRPVFVLGGGDTAADRKYLAELKANLASLKAIRDKVKSIPDCKTI